MNGGVPGSGQHPAWRKAGEARGTCKEGPGLQEDAAQSFGGQALTTEVAEVHIRLQASDQGIDIRVVELQALQESNGPVLPSGLQQVQQVPLGKRERAFVSCQGR